MITLSFTEEEEASRPPPIVPPEIPYRDKMTKSTDEEMEEEDIKSPEATAHDLELLKAQ